MLTVDIYYHHDAGWEETEHPRGQPENKGEFVKKSQNATSAAPTLSKRGVTMGQRRVQSIGESAGSFEEKIAAIKSFIAPYSPDKPAYVHGLRWIEYLSNGGQPKLPTRPNIELSPYEVESDVPKRLALANLVQKAFGRSPTEILEAVPDRLAQALDNYTGLSEDLNNKLRTGKSLDRDERDIAQAMGEMLSKPVSKVVAPFKTFRGVTVTPVIQRKLDAALANKSAVIVDPGFMSTSVFNDTAAKFGNATYEIVVPKGAKAVYLGGAEAEVVLPRNTVMRVIGKRHDDGRDVYQMKALVR